MNQTGDNTRLFIELYNTFDDLLREKYHESVRNFSVITRYTHQLEKSSSLLNQKKARKLNMIRILRNDLVHEFDLNSLKLIKVSDETIEFLKEEIEHLRYPLTAYSICTKVESLACVSLNDPLSKVLEVMHQNGFTQMPLIINKKLEGVFSPNVLFSYFAKYGTARNKELVINDLLEFLPIKLHISEKYGFIERDANIDDVFELYDDAHRENKKLVAIFVTENGFPNEAILGMIVPYDLLKTR